MTLSGKTFLPFVIQATGGWGSLASGSCLRMLREEVAWANYFDPQVIVNKFVTDVSCQHRKAVIRQVLRHLITFDPHATSGPHGAGLGPLQQAAFVARRDAPVGAA